MVQTRSMSKKTDPKIAVHKVVERASKQTRKKEKMNSNVKEFAMVQTGSMSKKTDPKIAVHKVVERASKQTRKEKMNSNVKVTKKVRTKNADCYSRPVTIDDDARIIFMEDYIIRHPLSPNTGFLPIYAGYSEWNQMSARDKAPFIKKARERNAKPAFDHHALYY